MLWEEIKSFNNLQKLLTLDHVIVMQWTGLFDKYLKAIYEGDILRFDGGTTSVLSSGGYPYTQHKSGSIFGVQWLPSGFTLRTLNQYGKNDIPNEVGNVGQYQFWNHQRSLVVIGNAFENPELLNFQK